MKSTFTLLCCLFLLQPMYAKRVKFSVDMSQQTVSVNGIHVSGDFQDEAGFPNGDWQSNTTLLTQETGTDIYSIILDLPANRKYEYKYVNGDQFYEAEFVPEVSRAGFEFSDNRWFWLDSTDASVYDPGAILFAANAPVGKLMLRLQVDLKRAGAVNSEGIFVLGSFNNFVSNNYRLTHFDPSKSLWEMIVFVDEGEVTYRYCNGRETTGLETVPGTCATMGDRSLMVSSDTIIDLVCFNECTVCSSTGLNNTKASLLPIVKLFPNPSQGNLNIQIQNTEGFNSLQVFDLQGKVCYQKSFTTNQKDGLLSTEGWENGLYVLQLSGEKGNIGSYKFRVD